MNIVCLLICLSGTFATQPIFIYHDQQPDAVKSRPLIWGLCASDNLLIPEKITLVPDPPKRGAKLKFSASGQLSKPVTLGARLHYTVWFGVLPIVKASVDLCEFLDGLDEAWTVPRCPIPEGSIKVLGEQTVWRELPMGRYSVRAEAVTLDGLRIICITGNVISK